jgi:HEAT repeat protein
MARSKTLAALAVASLATACGRAPEPLQSPAPSPPATNPAHEPPPTSKPIEPSEPSFGGKPLHEWIAWIEVDSYADSPSDETRAALRAMGAPAIAVIAKRVDRAPLPDAVRGHVLQALAAFGPAARETAIGLTKHVDPRVRAEAASWMRAFGGPGGDDIVDALTALFDDRDIGDTAVYSLSNIENPCARVLDALVRALDHPNAEARVRAAKALLGKGRVDDAKLVERFIAVLRDPSGAVRRESSAREAAILALATMDGDALFPSMDFLVATLDDEDDDVARGAVAVLGKIGPRAASAAPRLARVWCRTYDDGQRATIVDVLRRLGAADVADRLSSEATRASLLAEWLSDTNREVRRSAANRLEEMGPAAAAAIPALLAALAASGEDGAVHHRAMYALGRVGPGDPRVRAVLIASLLDEDSSIASAAASGLERGFAGDEAIREPLLAALRDRRCCVPGDVASALVPFGADVAPAIVDVLSRDSVGTSVDGVSRALRQLGADAAPALRAGLLSKRPDTRREALLLLAELKSPPADLATLAEKALDDADDDVRGTAADVLGDMGDAAKPAAPRLRAALADWSAWVRARAAAALWRATKDPTGCVDPLVEMLSDPDSEVRCHAAAALAEMGAAAAPAVPRIAGLLDRDDVHPAARDELIEVLRGVGPAAKPALAGLVRALHGYAWCSEQTYVPTPAIVVLGAIGPDAKSALPALRTLRKETPSLAADIDAAIAKIEAKP